jgi:hypothetical protein
MNRFLFGSLAALALAATATPAWADCCLEYNCCRHLSFVRTSKNRCLTFTSHANPLPCAPGHGYGGPALWDGLAAYGHAPAAYPAPVAAAPAAAAPAATTPSFKAPPPAPATKSPSGVQQAGYFYYGQPANAEYGYNAGYNYGAGYGYGYGYGASYAQAPNYWY